MAKHGVSQWRQIGWLEYHWLHLTVCSQLQGAIVRHWDRREVSNQHCVDFLRRLEGAYRQRGMLHRPQVCHMELQQNTVSVSAQSSL